MRILLILCCILVFPAPGMATLLLQNDDVSLSLDPATMAVELIQPPLLLATPLPAHPVMDIRQTSHAQATWTWPDVACTLEVRLDGRQLHVSVSAQRPVSVRLWHQPALGDLILPVAEGRYIPRGDKRQAMLAGSTMQTTQDLSLPLWGKLVSGDTPFGVHMLLTNPYNNTLHFADNNGAMADGLEIELTHRFSPLSVDEPMTFILALADTDPLAGAKIYKEWLTAQGQYTRLSDKIKANPEGEKLLGASHVYLWDSGLLAPADVADWPAFLKLLHGPTPLARALNAVISNDLAELKLPNLKTKLYPEAQQRLINTVNNGLNILARARWLNTEPDMTRLRTAYSDIRAAFAQEFSTAMRGSPSAWGDGMALGTVERLQQAGLSRLWIGTGAGWETGLWHPEAVAAAVQAGYLVAPYDSYQTALPQNGNPDWVTAHLGQKAFADCAIVKEDGTLRSGFQNKGHYTDPRCVRPLLQERVAALRAAVPYNSWFLDSYSAGMLFESYSATPLRLVDNATENAASLGWFTSLGLPVGSEDGNTNGGILFAHGMQTPVIGWGDADMANKTSPWYTGAWYPANSPSVFFRAAPLKDIYREFHLDPAYRLPLYQTVFHGSVITTHHWLFDNLKPANALPEQTLMQLLYAVPPLYNLSGATMAERLPTVRKMDAFFRPLHQRLALQALTGFAWLTPDRLVQECRFADGTRLIANFRATACTVETRELPPYSVTELLPDDPGQQFVFTQ